MFVPIKDIENYVETNHFPEQKSYIIYKTSIYNNCNGVANCLVLPPTPHKRASRPAPDL